MADPWGQRAMSVTFLGALATAGALGVTHALEPDHVAGISSLTSRYGDARLSALVGVCFSAGHVALVVVWLGFASLVLGNAAFPAILDTLGTVVVSVALGVFGALLAIRGYRAAASAHAHDRAHDHQHRDPHVHLPLVGGQHDHTHGTRAYLKTGLVGALFTLSPPLSMIAFLGTVIPAQGVPAAGLSVAAYAVGITATMALLGAGVGGLFGLSRRHDRAFGVLRLVTGVAVVALAASLGASVLAPVF